MSHNNWEEFHVPSAERRIGMFRSKMANHISSQEYTDRIVQGEAIRKEWHQHPIPRHRALTIQEQNNVPSYIPQTQDEAKGKKD